MTSIYVDDGPLFVSKDNFSSICHPSSAVSKKTGPQVFLGFLMYVFDSCVFFSPVRIVFNFYLSSVGADFGATSSLWMDRERASSSLAFQFFKHWPGSIHVTTCYNVYIPKSKEIASLCIFNVLFIRLNMNLK